MPTEPESSTSWACFGLVFGPTPGTLCDGKAGPERPGKQGPWASVRAGRLKAADEWPMRGSGRFVTGGFRVGGARLIALWFAFWVAFWFKAWPSTASPLFASFITFRVGPSQPEPHPCRR